jgi:nucleotide-binding universal stress UspA family protein
MPNDAIVVGFDGTVGSHAALFAAVNLAHATHRPVVVVHVVRIQPIVEAGTSMGRCQMVCVSGRVVT